MPKPTFLTSPEKNTKLFSMPLSKNLRNTAWIGVVGVLAGIVIGRTITILIIAALILVGTASRREPSEALHHV